MFETGGEKLIKSCETNKMRPRMCRPAAVHGSPYRHSYWRRYRKSRLKSYNEELPRQWGNEAGHRRSDVVVSARAAGVEWTVIGPILIAMHTNSSSIMLLAQVMKCVTYVSRVKCICSVLIL